MKQCRRKTSQQYLDQINSSYQDVSLQKQAWFNGDADTGVAVSLYIAVVQKKQLSCIIFSYCLPHRVSCTLEHKLH